MTLEECYQELGGNFDDVITRLPSRKMVERFLGKFLEDRSFEELCRKIAEGKREDAFRAAHTLKGVCANLSLNRLLTSADTLTEELRAPGAELPAAVPALLEDVRRDYQITVDAIVRFRAEL